MTDAPDPSLEAATFKRGPGGRPTREEAERRHKALLDAATELFLEGGLNGASIDAIAEKAGVAKRFIYARYADKDALFTEAIERLMADVMGTLHLAEPLPDDVEEGLVALGRRMLDVALQPEALAFFRQFIAEAGRLQELARHFVDSNPVLALIGEVLRTYADRGAIKIDDPRLTAEHFAILVIGIPRMKALFVGREPPAEEERRLRAAVRQFLDGCRAG